MKTKEQDLNENRLYNILIISLIIGLIITSIAVYYFRVHVYGKPEYFSELYFPEPDNLPNKINLNTNYDYSFAIKSNEEYTKKYKYETGIELYNLYDFTEGKYHCLSKYRDKIYLDWTNASDFTLINEPKKFEAIEKMFVLPNYKKKINWPQYTVEFGFPPPTGVGQLVIFFRNETDMKYHITIDEANNKTFFNQEQTSTGVDLKSGNNKIRLIVKEDNIKLFLNSILVVNKQYSTLYNGQFGFESQDVYFNMGSLNAYKDSPVVVPDSDTIMEYHINRNFLIKKMNELKQLTSKSIRLLREFKQWNETIDCKKEPFYCEYFDLPNDISFYLKGKSLTKAIEKIPVAEGRINYVLYPVNTDEAEVGWQKYQISFSHGQLKQGSIGHIILKFENKWAVMITRNNSYFFRHRKEGILVDEIRNPLKPNQLEDKVLVEVSKQNIILKINNETVFTKDTPKDYTNGYLEVYIKNSLITLSPIHINKISKACGNPLNFEFCELILQTIRPRSRDFTEQEDEFRIDYFNHKNEETKFNLFSGISKEEAEEEKPEETPILDIPIYNPAIPDRRIILNKPTTIIKDYTNFSIEYDYHALDGARVLEIGLLDYQENEQLSMYVLEKESKVIISYPDANREKIREISLFMNQSRSHRLKLEIREGDAFFFIDHKEIYSIPYTYIRNGKFFIGSRNTYLELRGLTLNIGDIKLRKSLRIGDDPCELKLIQKQITEKHAIVKPGSSVKITKKFNITHDFDYGKVYVKLYGSAGINKTEPLEIHYWVMRDDS